MKNFLILCSIFIFAYLVRFYHFDDRIIFWTEQAKSLETSINYLQKPSLLGQEYFRQDSNSHIIYSGALFNWSLLPIILFSKYDIIKITTFFGFLNILTGFLVFLVARRFFGIKTAFYSSIFFLFNCLMIYHSLFIWNYNFLPLIGLMVFHLTLQNFKEYKLNNFFCLGFISGIGFSLQILFIIYSLIFFLLNIIKSKQKILNTLIFVCGLVIGNLPLLIFDLRHDFYQTKTIWFYLLDTIHGVSDANFAYYYLLPLFPILSILFGWILSKINTLFSILLLIFYLYLNSKFNIPNSNLTVSEIDFTTRNISNDINGDFNIASLIDFDKRFYTGRYLLKYKYKKEILGVEEYKNIKTLYVLAPNNYDFQKSDTWEITAGGKYKILKMQNINNRYTLFKLTK